MFGKKGFVFGIPIIVALIALFVGGVAVAFPGVLQLGPAEPCNQGPFDSDCTCNLEQEQLSLPRGFGTTSYFCEDTTKVLDTTNPNFGNDAISLATSELTSLFPQCDMASCGRPSTEWKVDVGVQFLPGNEFKRTVLVECLDDSGLFRFAQANVDVVSGTASNLGCSDFFGYS